MSELRKRITAMAVAAVVPRASTASSEVARDAIEDRVRAHKAIQMRSLQLSQQLGINTVVDVSGWLGSNVELLYHRDRVDAIQPILVRVGQDAADREVLAGGGIRGRCRKYNEAIDRLRELDLRLGVIVRDRRIEVLPGTVLAAAHAELARLEATIAQRQAAQMGRNVVHLDVLALEIAFFAARVAELTPIVIEAERAAAASWDGDTQDVVFDGFRTSKYRKSHG
jgi:hypothetical protein